MPADKLIAWQLDLSRLDAHARVKALLALTRLQKELLAKLRGEDLTAWARARANRLLAEAIATINAYYGRLHDDLAVTLEQLVPVAALSAQNELAAAVLADLNLPVQSVMKTLFKDTLLLGAPQKAWWARQAADVAFRFSAAVRQGMVAAETNKQIIDRVMLVMTVSQRNAAALVQTSVHTVANEARMATFRANSDVITGVKWIATLDNRTCPRCGELDGQSWKLDGTPITATESFKQPPIHWNDRCVLSAQTRLSDKGTGQRASMAGPVDRRVTFDDWLERQSQATQDDVLGKGRADMYREGKITLADLTSGNGRPLTLKQLKEKHK